MVEKGDPIKEDHLLTDRYIIFIIPTNRKDFKLLSAT